MYASATCFVLPAHSPEGVPICLWWQFIDCRCCTVIRGTSAPSPFSGLLGISLVSEALLLQIAALHTLLIFPGAHVHKCFPATLAKGCLSLGNAQLQFSG